MTGRALLLAPSCGLGGGIERYVETLEWAFAACGVDYHRINLHGSGPAAHVRLLAQSRRQLREDEAPTRLVLAHRALIPVASLLARERSNCGISLVCHGVDIWGARRNIRSLIENHLMRSTRVRMIAVSSFTAGAVSAVHQATVLPPGLSKSWFDLLVNASAVIQPRAPGTRLATAFRLSEWRDKGLPELLAAVADLRRPDVSLTVCGSGVPQPDLLRLIENHPHCTLRVGLTDHELARELAEADLFVLATRTRRGRHPSGEGYGLVLLEAQVAGTAVVGPAFGGSYGAFIDLVTGVAPQDETIGALKQVLDELLKDPARLAQMGRSAAEWARKSFAPEIYASRAVTRLL